MVARSRLEVGVMSKRIAALALAAALLAVPLSSFAADPYEIYVLLPLTGSASFYGTAQQQSLHAVEDETNRAGGIAGRPIKFDVSDDQSNPQIAVQLATQIIAKHVAFFLGPTLTAECNAVMPLLLKEGPVTYCFTPGAHPPAGSYVFGFGADTGFLQQAALTYLGAKGIKKIAIIASTDGSGQDGEAKLDEALAKQKMVTLVAREHFAPTDVSVAAQLARIKAADPDAIVVWTTGTPFGTVLRGIKDSGIELPVLTTNGNLTRAQMKQYAPFLPKDLIFPGAAFFDPDTIADKRVKGVVDEFLRELAAQNAKPDWGNNNCYDGARLMVSALKKFGPAVTPNQIRDYIENLKGWPGINGIYDFPAQAQRGLAQDSVVMVRWDAAKDNWVALSKPGGVPLPGR
jgi:branched-chain amino acid transport system substrate-binding protein